MKSRDILAKQSGESKDQIRRYIRLTSLIRPILDMVDENRIALRPAVELSYLTEPEEQVLLDTMACEDRTPSHAQAIKLRKFSQDGKLNENVALSIMQEEKPNQVEQFKMPRDRLSRYFPAGTPTQKMEEIILKALELYRRRERSWEMER